MSRPATAPGVRSTLAVATVAAMGVAAWAYRDYRAWLAPGAGGLPANPRGWLRTTY